MWHNIARQPLCVLLWTWRLSHIRSFMPFIANEPKQTNGFNITWNQVDNWNTKEISSLHECNELKRSLATVSQQPPFWFLQYPKFRTWEELQPISCVQWSDSSAAAEPCHVIPATLSTDYIILPHPPIHAFLYVNCNAILFNAHTVGGGKSVIYGHNQGIY